jgi:hypothetical protein
VPDRYDYKIERVTHQLVRTASCVACGLRHAEPSGLFRVVDDNTWQTVCNDCLVVILHTAGSRLPHQLGDSDDYPGGQ